VVSYCVVEEQGPPHARTFEIRAEIQGAGIGHGSGRSKKDAEQEAARVALEGLESK